MADDQVEVLGEWELSFRHWRWRYVFSADGSVTWRDPLNGMNGKGRWRKVGPTIHVAWPSGTTENWPCPINPEGERGMYASSKDKGPFSARRLSAGAPGAGEPPRTPPAEGQMDATACWAASYVWWLKATPGQRPVDQKTIMSQAFSLGVVDNTDGTIQIEPFRRFLQGRHGDKRVALLPASEVGAFLRARDLARQPVIIGFRRGPLGGHINVIHGIDGEQVQVMEPWWPEPDNDPSVEFDKVDGYPVYSHRGTGAPFVFRGTLIRRPLNWYTSGPVAGGKIFLFPG